MSIVPQFRKHDFTKVEKFEFKDLTFVRKLNNDGTPIHFASSFNGLHLKVRGDELTITNSLQKFYHDNNYGDFYLSEVQEAIETINEKFEGDYENAEVKKISYGLNLPIEPHNIYNSLKRITNKTALPMTTRNGAVYGNKIQLTDYSLKAYNKTAEVKAHDKATIETTLRIEKEIRNMRHLLKRQHQIPIFTVKDIMKKENFISLGDDLISTYNNAFKLPIFDYENLSPSQTDIIHSMFNPDHRSIMKKYHPDTYKKRMKKVRDIIMEQKADIRFEEISVQMRTKINMLANG